MTGEIKLGSLLTLPPTQKRIEIPIHVTSVVWNPEVKVAYESISPPTDRFEGNTKGAGAVFGLLFGAGLAQSVQVGDLSLMLQQWLTTDVFGGALGKVWSKEEDVPAWWKSQAKGADPTDL